MISALTFVLGRKIALWRFLDSYHLTERESGSKVLSTEKRQWVIFSWLWCGVIALLRNSFAQCQTNSEPVRLHISWELSQEIFLLFRGLFETRTKGEFSIKYRANILLCKFFTSFPIGGNSWLIPLRTTSKLKLRRPWLNFRLHKNWKEFHPPIPHTANLA